MSKQILLILALSTFLFAGQDYSKKHFIFCLKNQMAKLSISSDRNNLVTNYPQINNLMIKNNVISVKKWLTSATDKDTWDGINFSLYYEATFDAERNLDEISAVIGEFKQLNEVQIAGYLPINRLCAVKNGYVPNDTYFDRQWYIKKIMADDAWALWNNQTPGDSSILIGIVDTGIDYLHPDLADAMYINPGEDIDGDGLITEADKNGVDDDDNGYIDDFMGWDFAGESGTSEDNDIRPPGTDENLNLSHGTHVAGIAAATADNNLGIAGVSFRSKIIATKHMADDDTSTYIQNGYDGILYCAKMGADIINCSWGGRDFSGGQAFINLVKNNYGSIIVCAAGNEDTDHADEPHYPSGYDNTIAVAATNVNDRKAYYSNYGDIIDISAPGGEGSTYANAIYSTIQVEAGSYTAFQGTSMSSPVVAGCLALLKAWYPDQTNDRITDLLINSADDIDELNSSYAGKLGSGRVNVYNAIARSIFPSLSIVEFFTEVVDENGDDEINPGENFKLSFIVENADGWQDADNVTINLSPGSPSVSMIDSSAVIGIIAAGEADYNTDDELTAKISSDANYEPVKILVSITANQSADHPYNYKDSIEVAVSLNQPGFPVTGGAVDVPVTVDNIAGDALPEIITIDADNKLNVYDNNGGMVEGFPYNIGSYVSMCPALADVDNDGRNDIIFASRSGELYIIDHSGDSLLYKDIGEQIFGNISIANMDDDDDLEIVFGTMLRNLHVLNPDGTELPGFPKNCGVPIEHGISLADLDSDGIPEMVAGLFNSTLVILKADGDTLNNFPVTLSSRIKATPLVVKTESSFKIIAATLDQNLNIINSSGAIENQYKYEASIAGPPALCDLQDDGNIEIFFGTEDGLLHGVNIAGESLENFPVQLNGAIRTSPVFAEFDDDNIMDIVITTASGYVYIIDSNGQLYPGFPAILDDYLNGSPAVSDIDRDGDLEIISGGGKGLYVFDIKGQKGNRNFWQTFLGNNRRTGFYGDGITNIENSKSPGVIENFILYQNFPNPFNPVTTINFNVPDNVENEILKLDIFNILGQRIVSLFSGRPAAGLNTITWDGKDMNGKRVPSGIYVYSLYNDKIHLTRKLLFIK